MNPHSHFLLVNDLDAEREDRQLRRHVWRMAIGGLLAFWGTATAMVLIYVTTHQQ